MLLVSLVGLVGCGSSNKAGTKSGGPEGGAGSGGMSGAAGGGAAGAAGGGAGGMLGAPQWLAYDAPDGNFAYDAATFPATEVTLLSAPPAGLYQSSSPAWSPDGKHLAYLTGDALALREMTGHTPGPEVTLATGLTPNSDPSPIQWSADSKSILVASGTSLFVLDPSSASPALNLVSSDNVMLYQWAPTGAGLIFRDSGGVRYARVDAGFPSPPELVGMIGNSWGWSPDGRKLVVQESSDIFLYDVGGATVQSTLVAALPMSNGYANPVFSGDGSLFAFNMFQGIAYAPTDTPEMTDLITVPAPDAVAVSGGFNPSQPVMIFTGWSSAGMQTNQWFYVTFTGATHSLPTAIPGAWQYLYWVPGKLALFGIEPTNGQASYIDISGNEPVVTPYPMQADPVYSVQWSPVGERVAFFTPHVVVLSSLSDPMAPAQTIRSTPGGVAWMGWSSTASYMAILSTSSSSQERGIDVVRVDGSAPFPIMTLRAPGGTTDMNFSWQPVTP